MRKLQEYSEHELVPSVSLFLKALKKMPLPYTGNKKKLIEKIHDVLIQRDIKFDSVLDAFSGSATMSCLFKYMGKRVLANDLLTSSYINAVAFAENPGIKLSDDEKRFLLSHQNPNKGSFVEDNYLGLQFRTDKTKGRFSKFTLKECRHLDNFRANIDELCGLYSQGLGMAANAAVVLRLPFGNADQSTDVLKHRNKQEAAFGKESKKHDRRIGIYYDDEMNLRFEKWFPKYVDDFVRGIKVDQQHIEPKIKRASFLANLQQHVLRDGMVGGRLHRGQFLAEIDERLKHQKNQLKGHYSRNGSTEMDFITQAGSHWTEGKPGQGLKWWSFADVTSSGSCLATNMDVIDLLKSEMCKVDCVYFDPPYGGQSSDYAAIYRFLEEYIYSKPLEDLPHLASSQRFTRKKEYEQNFVEMLDAAKRVPIWIFSYNDSSWKSIEYITDIVRTFKQDVTVDVLDESYRYLYRSRQGRKNRSTEYLIIAQ